MDGVFIYNPLLKDTGDDPVQWVSRMPCEVECAIHNPLRVDVRLDRVALVLAGSPAQCPPRSDVVLPAGTTSTVRLPCIPEALPASLSLCPALTTPSVSVYPQGARAGGGGRTGARG